MLSNCTEKLNTKFRLMIMPEKGGTHRDLENNDKIY